ncbi:MAG TPA: DNA-binding response regulator [Chitinophagaceae bacterium]|nr:DNA-binding response regulator [Chitinophagaceae bacterium]HCY89370.1 DNA-binding response regulator [Chitinophagaceae bacterium]HRF27424.1 response regulator transcription factor [Ferruginibacter sp.]
MIRIAIIEDNDQYRKAIDIILQLDPNISIAHTLNNCAEMIGRFQAELPDVVLMDIDMPGMNGIQAAWEIKKHFPDVRIIMLTVFEDEEKIFGALKAGANGYLLKKDSPQKIIDSICAVHRGEAVMNGIIASKVLDFFQQSMLKEIEQSSLTDREKQILELLINGFSYKEIAASIGISVETLNSHIKNIYRKLNVHSRSELSAKYGRN